MGPALVNGQVHKLGVLGLVGVGRLRLRHIGALAQLAQALDGPQNGPLYGAQQPHLPRLRTIDTSHGTLHRHSTADCISHILRAQHGA